MILIKLLSKRNPPFPSLLPLTQVEVGMLNLVKIYEKISKRKTFNFSCCLTQTENRKVLNRLSFQVALHI